MSETAAAAPAATPVAPPPVAAPAAPPVAPAAPAAAAAKAPEVAPQNSAALAALAKEQVRLNQQRQELAAQRKVYEAAQNDAKELARLRSLAKENPAAFIKEAGVDYATLTKSQIESNKDGAAKRQDIDALRAEFNEKLAAEKKALEDARRQEMSQRQYQHFRAELSAAVKAAETDEKYEVLMQTWKPLTRAPDLESVLEDYIRFDLESQVASKVPDPKPMTHQQALEKANEDAIARYEEIPTREKLKRYAPKTPAAPEAPVAPEAKPEAKAPEKVEAKPAPTATEDDAPPEFKDGESWRSYEERVREYQRKKFSKKA